MSRTNPLYLLLRLVVLDILAVLFGEFFLSKKTKAIASNMIFTAGGILYLIFRDIAPYSKERKSWIPATGESFGFILGMVGEQLINACSKTTRSPSEGEVKPRIEPCNEHLGSVRHPFQGFSERYKLSD